MNHIAVYRYFKNYLRPLKKTGTAYGGLKKCTPLFKVEKAIAEYLVRNGVVSVYCSALNSTTIENYWKNMFFYEKMPTFILTVIKTDYKGMFV